MTDFIKCLSEDKTCANSISTLSMSSEDHSLTLYMNLQILNSTVGAVGEAAKKATQVLFYTDE
jgi:hypothetical protein